MFHSTSRYRYIAAAGVMPSIEDLENDFRDAFSFGICNVPARKVAHDVHAGRAMNHRAVGNPDLLSLARPEDAFAIIPSFPSGASQENDWPRRHKQNGECF